MAPKTNESTELMPSPAKAKLIAVAAFVAAGAPHFFLETPFAFYDQSNTNGWLGLTIWAPAFLAAVALFVGADATTRTDEPLVESFDARAAAAISLPIAVLAALGTINFDGFQHVISWSTLAVAMAVYAGVFAVGAFYWQALVQGRLLGGLPALVRPIVVAAAGAALWLPFLVNHDLETIGEPMAEHAIVYLALAMLYELGLPVYACMGAAVFMGLAFGWVHQMTFF